MNLHQGFSIFVLCILLILAVVEPPTAVHAQQPSFELPVELVGFPVIIIAVRLSNFVKKLAYSLNPRTYSSRKRRDLYGNDDVIDVDEAEKRLVSELGSRVCIYNRVCVHYALRTRQTGGAIQPQNLDLEDILSRYKSSTEKNKKYYLLSVFLGDIVGSLKLCNQLAKRRPCQSS